MLCCASCSFHLYKILTSFLFSSYQCLICKCTIIQLNNLSWRWTIDCFQSCFIFFYCSVTVVPIPLLHLLLSPALSNPCSQRQRPTHCPCPGVLCTCSPPSSLVPVSFNVIKCHDAHFRMFTFVHSPKYFCMKIS